MCLEKQREVELGREIRVCGCCHRCDCLLWLLCCDCRNRCRRCCLLAWGRSNDVEGDETADVFRSETTVLRADGGSDRRMTNKRKRGGEASSGFDGAEAEDSSDRKPSKMLLQGTNSWASFRLPLAADEWQAKSSTRTRRVPYVSITWLSICC